MHTRTNTHSKLSYAWVNIGLWSAAILIPQSSDCLSMCDCNHACASVLAINKQARLCFPGLFFYITAVENLHLKSISGTFILACWCVCASLHSLCALCHVHVVPLWISIPVVGFCEAEMGSTDAHICGPLKLVQFVFPYRRQWTWNMWKRRCTAKSDAHWSIFREPSTWLYVHLHSVQMHEILNYIYCWKSVPGTKVDEATVS